MIYNRIDNNNAVGGYNSILKLAVVVDIILDENHPYFNKETNKYCATELKRVKNDQIPINYKKEIPSEEDIDYSYIGRAKVRIINTDNKLDETRLKWAIPLHSGFTQYPLLNETVLVLQIGENLYYTNTFNFFNLSGVNASFNIESGMNKNGISAIPTEYRLYSKDDTKEIETALNKRSYLASPLKTSVFHSGFLGERFILNPFIRTLKRNEGDTVVESRFGQSIKFSAYDNSDCDVDKVDGEKVNRKDGSYTLPNVLKDSSEGGFGNPVITIRNRQRKLGGDSEQPGLHPKLNKIPKISDYEKNYGGQIEEDINNDGSTIELSSGIRKTKWISTVYKSMFGVSEEQPKFQPEGSTTFKYPDLDGDQIVVNSDRLIFSSRLGETFCYSKKRYAVVTDNEYTVDANDQIVFTTNNATTINSPQIFLGQWGETGEPAVLGQTLVDWLYELCDWLLEHTHWYHHTHPDTGDAQPPQTQIPVQILKLKILRDNLHKLLSRRVYVTGGGYAPGADGVKPDTGTISSNISGNISNMSSGLFDIGGISQLSDIGNNISQMSNISINNIQNDLLNGLSGDVEVKDPLTININTGEGAIGDFIGRSKRELADNKLISSITTAPELLASTQASVMNKVNTVKSTVSNTVGKVTSTVNNVESTAKSAVSNTVNKVQSSVGNVTNKVTNTTSNAVNTATSTANSVEKSINNTVSNVKSSISKLL